MVGQAEKGAPRALRRTLTMRQTERHQVRRKIHRARRPSTIATG
jgi:hypothetical protein